MIFDRHRPDITEKAQRCKIEELETELKKKDEVIAEIELVHTPEERTAVVKYVLTHKNFLYGYRYLAWQMIDENVAFVRPASVYNIMKEYDLVHK